jgi:hypothetical protein
MKSVTFNDTCGAVVDWVVFCNTCSVMFCDTHTGGGVAATN